MVFKLISVNNMIIIVLILIGVLHQMIELRQVRLCSD
jgi:hypothetical protein